MSSATLHTNHGPIEVELFDDDAPKTIENFRKLSGDVHMVHNGGISDDEIAEGYILACCSKPMGNVSVQV